MAIRPLRTGIVPVVLLALFLLGAAGRGGAAAGFIKPQARDKCPVCGMFVAKYPDWTAEMVFRDGAYAVFDGTKDLFKCYFSLGTCVPGKKQGDIAAIYVTDYYQVRPVDGRTAVYVMGSDVYGPMGRELIPFTKEKDARQFREDHGGRRILSFREVTPALVEELER